MKTPRLLLACIASCGFATAPAFAQGTSFTYQGVLSQGGAAVNGSNDLTFTLYNAASGGATVGTSNVVNDLVMSNGLFTVTLDFGAGAFDGTARWLQFAARPGASTGAYTNLAPRTSITPTPYAIYAGGANAANLAGTVADARLSANVALRGGGNVFSGNQTFTNGNIAIGSSVFLSLLTLNTSGYGLTHSDGTRSMATYLDGAGCWFGSFSADPLHLYVNNSAAPSMTLATSGNIGIGTAGPLTTLDVRSATPEITVGTVGNTGGALYLGNVGHGVKRAYNAVNDVGLYTTAADVYLSANGTNTNQFVLKNNGRVGIGTATPGALLHLFAGNDPTIKLQSDGTSEVSGRVSMRQANESGFDTYYDGNNVVDALVVESFTSGTPTAKPLVMKINGNVGIGATNPASRLHVRGASDTELSIQSAANDRRWTLQASGGTDGVGLGGTLQIIDRTAGASRLRIETNGLVTILTELTTTAVNITSDHNAKEQFKPVNARDVLDKVTRLPISEWQYKTQGDARHIGPMAQDFREAFSLGRDEKHITSVDADGVALAAIQGLNEKLEEKTQEVDALKKSVAALTELVNKLAAQQNGGAR